MSEVPKLGFTGGEGEMKPVTTQGKMAGGNKLLVYITEERKGNIWSESMSM